MEASQILPGMVFKENGTRFDRWIRIEKVSSTPKITTCTVLSSSIGPAGPWGQKKTTIRKIDRLHTAPWFTGYTLVTTRT